MTINVSEKAPAVCWKDENGITVRTKTSAIRLSGRAAGKPFKAFCDAHEQLKFWKTINPSSRHHVKVCDDAVFQAIMKTVNGDPPSLNGRKTVWLADVRRELRELKISLGKHAGPQDSTWTWLTSCPWLGSAELTHGQEAFGDRRIYVDQIQVKMIKRRMRKAASNGRPDARQRRLVPARTGFDGVYETRPDGDRLLGLCVARDVFDFPHGQLEWAIAREEIVVHLRTRPETKDKRLRRCVWESDVNAWREAEKKRRAPVQIPGFGSAATIAEIMGASTPGKRATLGATLADIRKANPTWAVRGRSAVRRREIWYYSLGQVLPILGFSVQIASAESAPSTALPTMPVSHSPDFRSINWFGTPYSFTGNQAAAIEKLWKSWERGAPDVGSAELTDHIEGRIVDLFRDHPAWNVAIAPGQTKGSRRLKVPENAKYTAITPLSHR